MQTFMIILNKKHLKTEVGFFRKKFDIYTLLFPFINNTWT